jgi:hypothetical protein
VHTLNFHPEAAGQFLAAENVLRPFQFANFLRAVFLLAPECLLDLIEHKMMVSDQRA